MIYNLLSLTFLVLLTSQSVFACIWQSKNIDGSSPYWSSNDIRVCFIAPDPQLLSNAANPLDEEYRNRYRDNMNTVKETIERQINRRSPFNLHGFDICSPTDSSKEMIRINMNESQGLGALAASIGPASKFSSQNLTMSSTDEGWPGGVKPSLVPGASLPERVRIFNDRSDISWTALHEVMHLLGFHHSEYWNSNIPAEDHGTLEVIQYGLAVDNESVMMRGYRSYDRDNLVVLSDTDVACLNHVANRTIENFPTRPAQVTSQCIGLICEQRDSVDIKIIDVVDDNRENGKPLLLDAQSDERKVIEDSSRDQ